MADRPDPLAECRNEAGQLDMEKVKAWEARLFADREASADKLQVIQENLLALQVCARADLSVEEITELVNRLAPAGTRNGWKIDEEVAPPECNRYYLFRELD